MLEAARYQKTHQFFFSPILTNPASQPILAALAALHKDHLRRIDFTFDFRLKATRATFIFMETDDSLVMRTMLEAVYLPVQEFERSIFSYSLVAQNGQPLTRNNYSIQEFARAEQGSDIIAGESCRTLNVVLSVREYNYQREDASK